MNKKQKEINKRLQREMSKKIPDIIKVKKLAKDLVAAEDDDLEFLGNSDDSVYKEVRHGSRCYKYAKWDY